MFAIKNRIQFNWGAHIAEHMKKSRQLQFLPFGYHISYLLNVCGVDVKGETTVPPKSFSQIDKAALGKLDLGWNPELKSFDYMSDHTIKIRRSKKPKSSSSASRHRSEIPISLSEKVDTLTQLVLETRAEMNERLNRLEALILRTTPPTFPTPEHTPTMDQPSFEEEVQVGVTDEEGGTEPLLDVDIDAQEEKAAEVTEVEEAETEAEQEQAQEIGATEVEASAEPSIPTEVDVNLAIQNVLADLGNLPSVDDID